MNCISTPRSYTQYIFEISTSIICGCHQRMQKCSHALWLWLIQNISCLSNSINIHTSFVLWALFNDLIIVYAPSTQLHPFKSMFMQLVYKITRYLGFKGWVIFSHRTLVVTELYLLESYSPHKIWWIQYIHSLLSFK